MTLHRDIILLRDGGTADMGDVTNEADRKARFTLPDKRFSLAFIRAHFGDVNGTADMTLNLDSHAGQFFDSRLYTFTSLGRTAVDGDADGHLRIPMDELMHWTYDIGDFLVCQWTNPDSPNLHWGLEVGLLDAS